MSSTNQVSSDPVKIPQRMNKYSYSVPRRNPNKYLFELEIVLDNGESKIIRKIDENRYTLLLDNNDNISYENIVSYNVNISIIPDKLNLYFSSSGELKKYLSFFSNQDNNVYIEFNRLNNGKATCTCRYVDYENLGLSISPPF